MLSREMAFIRFHRPGASRRPTLLGRAVAWLAVALVGTLAWLAVDPAAHARLHGHAESASACGHGCKHHHDESAPAPVTADADHRCVVTDFAAGATELALALTLIFAGWRRGAAVLAATIDIARAAPSCWHLLGRGPPLRA